MSEIDKYHQIVVDVEARGRFLEGKLASGQTPKPGQLVKLDSSGNFTVGHAGEFLILREQGLVGQSVDQAYGDGQRAYMYAPQPGDTVFVMGISGQTFNKGTRGQVTAAGKLRTDDGSTAANPVPGEFVCLEDLGALAADQLVKCRFGGSNATTV